MGIGNVSPNWPSTFHSRTTWDSKRLSLDVQRLGMTQLNRHWPRPSSGAGWREREGNFDFPTLELLCLWFALLCHWVIVIEKPLWLCCSPSTFLLPPTESSGDYGRLWFDREIGVSHSTETRLIMEQGGADSNFLFTFFLLNESPASPSDNHPPNHNRPFISLHANIKTIHALFQISFATDFRNWKSVDSNDSYDGKLFKNRINFEILGIKTGECVRAFLIFFCSWMGSDWFRFLITANRLTFNAKRLKRTHVQNPHFWITWT